MSESEISEIISNLRIIKDYGEFPRGKNYLYSRYKSQGLVYISDKKKTYSSGQIVKGSGLLTSKSRVKLTPKGYRILRGKPSKRITNIKESNEDKIFNRNEDAKLKRMYEEARKGV